VARKGRSAGAGPAADPVYSVILVTWNQLRYTVDCVESLISKLPGSAEIVFVDNGSQDGTTAYLAEIAGRLGPRAVTVFLDENRGWCGGVNAGLAHARGRYLVFLNNDVIVTPRWLEGLRECMDDGPAWVAGARRVGLVGPVTNSAGGPQQVANPPVFHAARLDEHALLHRQARRHHWGLAFFLSGFCLMMHRDCYEEIGGLDERFFPGGFDDNDLVLRAQERGWDCMIAGDVYVHHEGSATFQKAFPHLEGGLANREAFLAKWRGARSGPRKLVAAYRVKNAAATLPESLDAAARFADAIVVLDDGSTDATGDICRNHPGVIRYERQDLPFDERRDRNRVLAMAGELEPDWVISIDADEVFEMSRERAQRLMHLADPHAKILGFHWYTFWEPSRTYFRADGIFGSMSGFRMYKLEPGQAIVHGTDVGLHCGNIPRGPDGSQRYTDIRVRHLGYDHEDLRQAKLAFYRRMDQKPRRELVGNEDYAHLVSPTVTLRRYPPEHGVSLCVIARNEAHRLESFLSFFEPFVDEICIIDNESTDATADIAGRFTDRIARMDTGDLDLDVLRNRCLELATRPWILSLDPDEEISLDDLPRLQRLMDDLEVHAYTFQVANHQKERAPILTLAVRLFRNDPRIRYSRPVHETVEQSLKRHPELVVRPAEMAIQHFGFLKPDEQVEQKIERYYRRNRRYREEHPEDPLGWYNEALHLQNEGRADEAMNLLERALELDPAFLSPRSQLAFMLQERALGLWREMLERMPPDHPVRHLAVQNYQTLSSVTPSQPLVGNARLRAAVGDGRDLDSAGPEPALDSAEDPASP